VRRYGTSDAVHSVGDARLIPATRPKLITIFLFAKKGFLLAKNAPLIASRIPNSSTPDQL